MDPIQMQSVIEGLLFINGDNGISINDIKGTVQTKKEKQIKDILKQLAAKYENDPTCGLAIQFYSQNMVRMVTKKENAQFYLKLENIKLETKLTKPAYEVLTIIAYKGPITRPDIEAIRGVNCESVLYKLKMHKLIDDSERSEAVGRPVLYKITTEFMKYFNIKSLAELPELPEIDQSQQDIFASEKNE